MPEEKSENSMQFEFFDAFTAFLISIFLSAYFICRLFGLLFQPPLDLMHENNNSMWSCDNLYVKMYLNGFSGLSIYVSVTKATARAVRGS